MKKIIIITLAVLALFTSCNLDDQGIFAEVIDRTPSDNRKLSVIGSTGDILYFSSIKGLECYELTTGQYTTLDDSERCRNISIAFMLDNNNKIVYGITSATQEEVSFTAFYLLDIASANTVKLNFTPAETHLTGSFGEYAHDASGRIYKAVLTDNTLSFTPVCTVQDPESKRFVTRMDNIFVFTTDMKSETPETSTLRYYLFDGSQLKAITGLDNPGIIRSVAKEGDNLIVVFSADTSKAYRITGTEATVIGTVTSSKISRNFASFVRDGSLYYAYDKASAFNRLNLTTKDVTSNTISKISNVAIVGYYQIGDTNTYRLCTSDNGFFVLTVNSDGTVSIN